MRNKQEFKELYRITNENSNNFKDVNSSVLIKNPSSILIFRHIFGKSQRNFSKLISISSCHLGDLERGQKQIGSKTAKKISRKLNNLLANSKKESYYLDNIYENYKKYNLFTNLSRDRAKEIRKLRKKYYTKVTKKEVLNDWGHILNDPRLARIVGAINGDGHLQFDKINHKYLTSFNSNNFYEIEDINKEFRELFGTKSIIYKNYKGTKKNKIFFSGKRIALFLKLNGVVAGNKTNAEYLIPDWIINGGKKTKGLFLRGLYDTEGSIFCSNKRWRISINQSKNEILKENGLKYLNQIRNLLLDLKIPCSRVFVCKGKRKKRKDGSKTLIFKIDIEKKGFENFYKYINFNNKKKSKRLRLSLENGSMAKINNI